ncbi:MAG: outer membrane lipoprotein carrier protein LolA [Proteobacteria bacterium]|nr:outer membrane lipoprotein carrier protein LolA [Pseudomonadota bacterium]MBS0547246.1 outer membrane lipoprotein carrier protein LolA [Pseudomonadota bacterium]
MRAFFLTALAALSLVFASGASAQQADVGQVEQYFNSIRTLQARFVQTNPDGSTVQGTLSISRPGKMRFEYDPPSKLKVVADGWQVTMWDPVTRDFGQWPIGWTAASFLVKEPFKLSGDITVENVRRADGLLQLTMVQTRKPQEGKIIVRLSENPLQLRGWSIIDARNNQVNVALSDLKTGVPLADSLFKYDGPDAGQIMKGGNRN